MKRLKLIPNPDDRDAYLGAIAPWAVKQTISSRPCYHAGRQQAEKALNSFDLTAYGKSRNYLEGAVSGLSPYVSFGSLSLPEIYDHACKQVQSPKQIYKFIQELAWRDFWLHYANQHPDHLWTDIEPYKTGLEADDYVDTLPEDIQTAQTDCACINQIIQQLLATGYIHNHARMYLASYIVHWRRVKWQTGAKWFLTHLLDAETASNNLSWQWIASTFSNKPYIFNLENVQKYAGTVLDCRPDTNKPLAYSYEHLTEQLFPTFSQQKAG